MTDGFMDRKRAESSYREKTGSTVTAFGLWDPMEMHESLAFCSFWLSMTVPTLLLFLNYKGIWGKPQRVIRRHSGVL
jgi:hypothetical protein